MRVRIHPKVRNIIIPKGNKWGEFEPVTKEWIKEHFKNYWPMLSLSEDLELDIDGWFYNRYMQCYDHQIFKDGKWKNGVQRI